MNVLDKFRPERHTIGADSMVALQEDGKRAVDKQISDAKAWPVLVSLDEHSPRSVSDLSRECRIDIHQMKRLVQKLERQRMVRILE